MRHIALDFRARLNFVIAAWLLVIGGGCAFCAAAAPSTEPVSPAEQGRLDRGEQVRQVLLDTLEQSYRKDGVWPDELAAIPGGNANPVYLKPAGKIDAAGSGSVTRSNALPAVTVVLHEPMEQFPGGVWVGYADGHLEFAATSADLAACESQHLIQRKSPADVKTQPAPSAGELKLRLIDSDGQPVAGVMVGQYAGFGDTRPRVPHVGFASGGPLVSDAEGRVTVPATAVFDAKFSDRGTAPLYILDEQRKLVAQVELGRCDFVTDQVREIRLSPACSVGGPFTSVGLKSGGQNLTWTNTIIFKPGELGMYTMQCSMKNQGFEVPLAPGDYGIEAYGTGVDAVYRFIHIEPGERELRLQLDLPANTISRLIGQPAPEFRNIKGWEHGGPVKLADLRGKVVLLDFWGYWCGPCVGAMPALMALHDEFKEKGLVIIGVHDDSADSIAAMDAKLVETRKTIWGGRDLPFLVALDGGGPTRIQYTGGATSGATTAAYGVDSFPTTLAIGRDGRVIGPVDVRSPEARVRIETLLEGAGG